MRGPSARYSTPGEDGEQEDDACGTEHHAADDGDVGERVPHVPQVQDPGHHQCDADQADDDERG